MTIASTAVDGAQLLAAARELAPEIDARAQEGEAAGTVPADLIARLKAAGLFRLGMPRALGGWELAPLEIYRVIEQVAHADGSTGWSLMIGNATAFLAWLEPDAALEIVGPNPDISSTGMFGPNGTAVPDGEGGFTVSGRWPFNSGCPHSEWLMAGMFVMDGDGPRMVDGRPDWRFAWFPHEQAEIIDNWHVAGLKGTGSNDLTVSGIRIPERYACPNPMWTPARNDGPLYRLSFFNLVAGIMGGIPAGIGRRALDEFEAVARKKARGLSPTSLAHDSAVQVEYAVAKGQFEAARTFYEDAMSDVWETVLAGDVTTLDQRARTILAVQTLMRAARHAADVAFSLTGGAAIYDDQPLQRCWRDVHAASQHLFFSPDAFKRVATTSFGIEDPTSFML